MSEGKSFTGVNFVQPMIQVLLKVNRHLGIANIYVNSC